MTTASTSPLASRLPERPSWSEAIPVAVGGTNFSFKRIDWIATSRTTPDEDLVRRIGAIMRVNADESFEDGRESNLALRLRENLAQHGQDFIECFPAAVSSTITSPAAIAEALIQFGMVRDGVTEDARLRLLLAFVDDSDSVVRYGAARGLMELADVRAVAKLRRRLGQETNAFVRSMVQGAINALAQGPR